MTSPLPGNTSGTARLILGELGFQVGWQQPVYLANPAAGTTWSHKVNGPYYERLLTATFVFTADAVVANRFLQLALLDSNGKVIAAVPAGNGVVANGVASLYLTVDAPGYALGASGGVFGFLPDFLIPPDWTWQMQAFGMDPGDQFSNIILLVQQFPNDATSVTVSQ